MENNLVGEKTIAFSIAQEILTTSVNIPSLPANGKKILDTVRLPEEKIDIPSFVKLVESDPGLFTRILQLSNSTFYSEMDKIVSLRAAITRIGLIETVNTVCLQFFQKMLPKFPDIEGFSYNNFWAYSWVCAVANRRLGHPNLEMDVLAGDLYMTGMLQSMGKLLLAIHFPKEFSKCIRKAREFEQPLHKIEMDVFGTTDGLIASKVLSTWRLPSILCEGVAYCQMPELAPPEYKIVAGLTQFACSIAEATEIGSSGNGVKLELGETFLGGKPQLKIGQENIQTALVTEIRESLKDKADTVVSSPKPKRKKIAAASNKKAHSAERVSQKPQTKKKGVMGWVKSLWNSD